MCSLLFRFLQVLEISFIVFDLAFLENGRARNTVWLVFLRGQEGDVIAKTGRLNDQKVSTGAGLLDEGNAIGRLRITVELHGITWLANMAQNITETNHTDVGVGDKWLT